MRVTPVYVMMSRDSRMAFSALMALSPPTMVPEIVSWPAALFTWSLMSAPSSTGLEVTELL